LVNILLGIDFPAGCDVASGGRIGKGYGRRRRGRRLADYSATLAILFAVALAAAYLSGYGEEAIEGRAYVADGDTLELGGERVRLTGIDAPELFQTCQRDGVAVGCGRQARHHLVSLIGRAAVTCRGWQTDRYDRLLVQCEARGTDLNAAMVRDGWALAYGGYEAEQAAARQAGRGLWSLDFEAPRQWRREHRRKEQFQAGARTSGLPTRLQQALTGLAQWLKSLFGGT
jgi:endonuclease YncB( thermonuclease family)